MKYEEIELVYGRARHLELMAVFYRTDGATKDTPFVIDIHGGAWSRGHRNTGQNYDRLLAENGVCVLAIDFRQGPDHQHPAASADICGAIRFVKQTDMLGFNPARLGLVGSSSGGHLALLAGLKPNTSEHKGTEIKMNAGFHHADEHSAAVDFVIALWPVSNPIARYQYVKLREQDDASTWGPNFAPDRLVMGHQAYYRSEAEMSEASIQRILAAKEYQNLPDIFIVQAEFDLNVPVFLSQTLAGALKNAEARFKYKMYPGVAHGFAHMESEQTTACINDMITFISAAGR